MLIDCAVRCAIGPPERIGHTGDAPGSLEGLARKDRIICVQLDSIFVAEVIELWRAISNACK